VDFSGTVEFESASIADQDVEISYGTKHTVNSATYGINEVTEPAAGPFTFLGVQLGDIITVGPETGWDEDDGFTTNAGLLANWTGAGNANIPLSRGYEAVCLGLTHSGNSHRPDEYIDITHLPAGLGQLLLVALAAAGWRDSPNRVLPDGRHA